MHKYEIWVYTSLLIHTHAHTISQAKNRNTDTLTGWQTQAMTHAYKYAFRCTKKQKHGEKMLTHPPTNTVQDHHWPWPIPTYMCMYMHSYLTTQIAQSWDMTEKKQHLETHTNTAGTAVPSLLALWAWAACHLSASVFLSARSDNGSYLIHHGKDEMNYST